MESLPQVGGRFDAYGKSEISRRFESYKIVYVLILWEFRVLRIMKSNSVKIPPAGADGIFGGGRWIRTTEGIASRFTVCPLWPLGNSPILSIQVGGAGRRIRTPDLLITNQLLYRLSYTGVLNRTRLLYYGFRNCQALFSRISFSLGTEREQPQKGEARRKSRCLSPWDSF